MSIIISLIIIFFAIAIPHEIGHYLCAKKAGIRVYEFAIGFGPRLFAFKRNNTIYSINLLPIAGYVRLAGTNPDDPDEETCPENEKYYNKSIFARFITIIAGSTSNLIAAFLIFALTLFIFGMPDRVTNEVARVLKDSPAEKAGLMVSDKVLSLKNKNVTEIKDIVKYIHENPGNAVALEILRKNKKISIKAVPKYNKQQKVGMLGFQLTPTYKRIGFFESLWLGSQQLFATIVLFFYSLYMLATSQASFGDLMGPVGIAKASAEYAAVGIRPYLNILGFIMASVGMFNLLPIPPLDGGHIVFIIIEKIRGKAVDLQKQAKINQVGMTAMLVFFVIVTIKDLFFR